MFSVGDLVRVVRWPEGLPQIMMEVGVIDDIAVSKALCIGLELGGSNSGVWTVPLDCLEPEVRPEWLMAKEVCISNFKLMAAALQVREERIRTGKAEIAAKYRVTEETLEGIYRELKELYK